MKTLPIALSLLALGATGQPLRASGPEGTPAPGLHLHLEPLAAPYAFRLRVENQGPDTVLLLRPRSGLVDRFSAWGGWSLQVTGPGGLFSAQPFPGGIPPHTTGDLIELRPGESIGVVVHLERHVNGAHAPLVGTPGTYTLVARYHLAPTLVYRQPPVPEDPFLELPQSAPRTSMPLTFVVPVVRRSEAPDGKGSAHP